MRISLILSLLLLATGCVSDRKPYGNEVGAFNLRSGDIISATAERIDPSRIDTREGMPHFEAQLHLVLNDSGVLRFQQFIQAYAGEEFELRVNGQVLLAGVGVRQFRTVPRVVVFYVATMSEAEHFAASLKNRVKTSTANNSLITNRRYLTALMTEQRLGLAVHASTLSSAAVAYLNRYA